MFSCQDGLIWFDMDMEQGEREKGFRWWKRTSYDVEGATYILREH